MELKGELDLNVQHRCFCLFLTFVCAQVDKECTNSVHSIPLPKWVFYHCSVHSFYTFSHHSIYTPLTMFRSSESRTWSVNKPEKSVKKCHTLVLHFSIWSVKQVPRSGKPVATSGRPGWSLQLLSPSFGNPVFTLRVLSVRAQQIICT